jgi:hypothetical protein
MSSNQIKNELKINHLIIGAGIAGLYIGLQLLNKNENDLLILEAQPKDTHHGRLYTENFGSNDYHIELGASIFHSQQPNIHNYINLVNMNNDIVKYKPESIYRIIKNKTSDEANIYYKYLFEKCKQSLFKTINKNNTKSDDLTLDEASKFFLTKEEYNDFKLLHSEWFEHYDKNAILYFNVNEIEEKSTICTMKNGMQSLVNKGCEILSHPKINKIQYSSIVNDIYYDKKLNLYLIHIHPNTTIFAKHLYICTNLVNKINIHMPEIKPLIDMCKSKSCMRFYVQFDRVLKSYPNFIAGDHIGKLSIRTGKQTWLIGYMDDELADQLNKIKPYEFIDTWLKQMNQIFKSNYTMDNVIKYTKAYWKDAYVGLRKEFYSSKKDKISKAIQSKYKHLLLTFVPNHMGENIAWTEAHLYKLE